MNVVYVVVKRVVVENSVSAQEMISPQWIKIKMQKKPTVNGKCLLIPHCLSRISPFTTVFMKWTVLSLNLDSSIVASGGSSHKPITGLEAV